MRKIESSRATVPYRDKSDVQTAIKYLRANADPAYVLIFKIAVTTGLRISDVLGLRWENVINGRIEVVESKDTNMQIAKARNNVLKQAKDTLLVTTTEIEKIPKLMVTHYRDILPMLTDAHRQLVEQHMQEAIENVRPVIRVCELPSPLARQLKEWKRKNRFHDGGYLFSASLVKYGKATKPQPISRQSAWRTFKQIGKACNFDFNTSCHQLRKTFAVFLYESSGNDSELVIKEVGWRDTKYLQRYLAIEQDQCKNAVQQMHKDYLK